MSGNELVIREERPLTAKEIRAHVNLIQEVMRAVMKEGTHYGIVPGTEKKSLWKSGAEVLCVTFRIAPSYRSEDLSDGEVIRYRTTCVGTHQVTGFVLGEGMGECSSNEEKYKWKKATDREFEATPEDRRRIKYGRNKQGEDYEAKQVRAEPADIANTILKMSCKRAHIAMTLNVTGASDIFTQDIEDLPEGMEGAGDTGERHAAASTSKRGRSITEKQEKMIRAKLNKADLSLAQLCGHFQRAEFPEGFGMDDVNEVLGWIAAIEKGDIKPGNGTAGSDQPPKTAAALGNRPATDAQKRLIKEKLEAKLITVGELCEMFRIDSLDALRLKDVDVVLNWIKDPGREPVLAQ